MGLAVGLSFETKRFSGKQKICNWGKVKGSKGGTGDVIYVMCKYIFVTERFKHSTCRQTVMNFHRPITWPQ